MGNRYFITGGTGLIGKSLVKKLAKEGESLTLLVRNKEKALSLFGDLPQVELLVGDILNFEEPDGEFDYVIHGAADTSSRHFVEMPTEIISNSLDGTKKVLELARKKKVKAFVFLSSMEVYGTPSTDEPIDELHSTNLNTMSVRSGYPESKRMCENLCAAYYSQFQVPAKVIRLTQTFGEGVNYNDSRVFAEFARCIIEKRDIVLHSKGETKRSYLAVSDAVEAILTVLKKGNPGEAYNAANESTYCSILEMANLAAGLCETPIRVRIEGVSEKESMAMGYAPTLHMNLDTTKLQSLGWKPTKGLPEMFKEMVQGPGF